MRRFMFVVLVVAGCGDDGHRAIPDGPVIDDAPNDSGGMPVSVTIAHNGQPTMGAKVYFQNADSSLVLAASTDVNGNASAVMAAGGYVTTIEAPGLTGFGLAADELHTWAGVKPGDHLLLTDPAPTSLAVTVTIPTDAAHTVTDYQVASNCGSGTLTVPVGPTLPPTIQSVVSFHCATADILVTARGPSQVPLSSFFVSGAALTDGGALDVHASTYDAAITRSYTYTNYPDPAVNLALIDAYFTARGIIYERSVTHVGDVATNMAAMPKPFTGAGEVVVTQEPANGSYTERHFLDWQAPGDYTADFGSKLVEDFNSQVAIDTTHKITWTETGGALQSDFAVMRMSSSRASRTWTWTVISPGTPNIQLPTLPTDVFDYNYASGDPWSVGTLDSYKLPGGYDAVRANMLSGIDLADLVSGPSGTISGNSWRNPP